MDNLKDGAVGLRGRAQAALDLGRNDDAMRLAKTAIAADPEAFQGYALLALGELRTGRPQDALATVSSGLAKNSRSEWLHRQRALALRQLGRTKEAVEAAREAVAIAPEIATCHLCLAQSLAARRRHREAVAAATRAVELDPRMAEAHSALGDLWLKKKPAAAARHYRESLAINPENAIAHNNLGVALLRMKRPVDAVLCFKSAMMLDPTLQPAKRNIHNSMNRMLAGGGFLAFAIVANIVSRLGSVGASAGRGDSSGAAAFVGVIVLLLVLIVFFVVRRRRRNALKEKLEQADPGILKLHELLKREKRAGRL